jgi:hypothetical protein
LRGVISGTEVRTSQGLGYLRSSYFQTGCRSLALLTGAPPRQSLVPQLPSRTRATIGTTCILLGDCPAMLTDFDAQLPQVAEDADFDAQCRHCQSAALPPHHHSTVLKLPSERNPVRESTVFRYVPGFESKPLLPSESIGNLRQRTCYFVFRSRYKIITPPIETLCFQSANLWSLYAVDCCGAAKLMISSENTRQPLNTHTSIPSPTMAPFSNRCDGGHDDWMQPANGLWDPEDDIGFSDFLTDALMMQASSGMVELPRIISSNSGSLIPSRAAFSVPRGGVALEQIQEIGINHFREPNIDTEPQHLPSSTANPNTEGQQTSDSTVQDEDTQEDEPAYVTHPEASHPPKRSRKETGPSSAEWAARKDEIKHWYIEKNYTCEMTIEEMAKKRFHATSVI